MSRALCYLSTDRYRLSCALHPIREQFRTAPGLEAKDGIEGFGIGYYHNGDVLLRKRPSVKAGSIDVYAELKDLQADCFLMHRRIPTAGALNPENTHPFRYRRWLFVHHGRVPGMDTIRPALLGEMPDHLRRGIRGTTDSEVLFHVMLTFLHHEGRIDDPGVEAAQVGELMRATVWRLRSLLEDRGAPATEAILDMAITNGHVLAATCLGRPLHYALREGMGECELCGIRADGADDVSELLLRSHRRYRGVFLSADHDPARAEGWITVPDASVVTVDRALGVDVKAL
jgi:glutamine amidotransferase